MTARPGGGAVTACAIAGAAFAVIDIGAGLLLDGAYTFALAYLHLLVVGVGAAGVVAGVWQNGRGAPPALLMTSCALLLGAQLPWSLAGLTGRPWFAQVGLAAPVLLAAALVQLSGWDARPAADRLGRAFRGGAPRGAYRESDDDDASPPRAPGWYPDPEAQTAPCWRWWDGRDWTEHRSPGATG